MCSAARDHLAGNAGARQSTVKSGGQAWPPPRSKHQGLWLGRRLLRGASVQLRWENSRGNLFQADTARERPSVIPPVAFNLAVIKAARCGGDDTGLAEPHCSLRSRTRCPQSQVAFCLSKPWKNEQGCSG